MHACKAICCKGMAISVTQREVQPVALGVSGIPETLDLTNTLST